MAVEAIFVGEDDGVGQVVVEAAKHGQLGELFVGNLDGAQCVWHGPGRVGDDEGVPGVFSELRNCGEIVHITGRFRGRVG